MRSGFFKQGYGELVVLTDSPAVKWWTAALLVVMALAPFVLGNFLLSHLTIILFTTVGALGLMVLTGFTGLISLGHVGFLMLGGYAYAIAVTRWGLPPEIALVLSAVLPALFGLIVGIPSLRLHGLYLAITTLAFAHIVSAAILAGGELTGGGSGIMVERPVVLGMDLSSDRAFYWFCLGVCALAVLLVLNLRRSYVGRALVAVRDNDIAARTMGISLVHYKLLAFLISAALTGLAGGLMAIYMSFVSVEGYPFLLSIEALAIVIVGGIGSVLGAVLGTVFIVTLPEVFASLMSFLGGRLAETMTTSAHEVKTILYGIAIIAFLRFDPRGLRGIWHDLRHTWVHWPLRY
ncbi:MULTISPECIES: branched-chain amino acid ABC transporter permease [Hydrogenophaga]|uniref:High-affinity branched-chain amino acid transport system permease protein n=1 Tax=Hydrogenophaga intermedia TaxID=65786 RepID=A0A1L1PR20_HYDIT|nr:MULTISPECIES: branched-chain amino acid ABC transporter permease [Hydrogenophaga]AOS81084.1 branched-chain amino acid ABC transporter permease [Hydrogenophaga sp. PBC]TMU71412.1 branched-chain amino acid ABC transporter permease [Hydrogenophaga intermedia]CDN90193.1 High-affinity branched-chain amino acid transport system permease protein [Hydrogenophaga intermedia]